MAKSAIRADIHEPLDVHRYFFAEVTFDAALRVDHLRDLADLFLVKLLASNPTTDPHLIQDGSGTVVGFESRSLTRNRSAKSRR